MMTSESLINIPWLTPELQSEIVAHASEEPENEVCGVILGIDGGAELVRSTNCHPIPSMCFTLDVTLSRQAQESNCLAVYHSHTKEDPTRHLSFGDTAMANRFKVPVLLYHNDGLWDYYDPRNANPYPLIPKESTPDTVEFYLDWAWDWGRVCCGRLIYHYYLGRLGIELTMPTTSSDGKEIFDKGWDKYRESLIANGFVEVEDMQDHDIVLMSLASANAHHGAIVVDADAETLLHIDDPDALSRLEKYHVDLKNKSRGIWRHPSFH